MIKLNRRQRQMRAMLILSALMFALTLKISDVVKLPSVDALIETGIEVEKEYRGYVESSDYISLFGDSEDNTMKIYGETVTISILDVAPSGVNLRPILSEQGITVYIEN